MKFKIVAKDDLNDGANMQAVMIMRITCIALIAATLFGGLAIQANFGSFIGEVRELSKLPTIILMLIGTIMLLFLEVWNVHQHSQKPLVHDEEDKAQSRGNIIRIVIGILALAIAIAAMYFIIEFPTELLLLLMLVSTVPIACSFIYWIICIISEKAGG